MEQNERHEKKIREGRKKEKELRQKNKDILSRAEEEIQYLSLEKLVIEYLLFFSNFGFNRIALYHDIRLMFIITELKNTYNG
jgi:hypothetical protein